MIDSLISVANQISENSLTLFSSCLRIYSVPKEVFQKPGVRNENSITDNHALHHYPHGLCC
jgi:hypothetical protein